LQDGPKLHQSLGEFAATEIPVCFRHIVRRHVVQGIDSNRQDLAEFRNLRIPSNIVADRREGWVCRYMDMGALEGGDEVRFQRGEVDGGDLTVQ
jgi:hypothetical protein